jgi:anti-anti-sigma factor
MGAGATVDLTAHDGVCVAALAGEVDLLASKRLTSESLAALGTSGTLVLDLSEVTFLDSTGLRLVFSTRRRLARHGRHLAVVLPRDERVRQIFAMIDAADALDLFETVEDALQHSR